MRYVEAPSYDVGPIGHVSWPAVFMAGGITGCPDWQSTVRAGLEKFPYGTLFNPRRVEFSEARSEEQIAWEFHWLNRADLILFWFCKEQIQPIALYELGAHMMRSATSVGNKPKLVLGVEKGYPREDDVIIQAQLRLPGLQIGTSLDYVIRTTYAYLEKPN